MRTTLTFKSLKDTTPKEYISRFVFGGLVTVFAGMIADRYGPVIGGLFLAFPGIFPASISLVEKHKRLREEKEGKIGIRPAGGEASVEAAGASIGALGLVAFAISLWLRLPSHGLASTLLIASVAWALLSLTVWWVRERL
jgi:hypothetical protein